MLADRNYFRSFVKQAIVFFFKMLSFSSISVLPCLYVIDHSFVSRTMTTMTSTLALVDYNARSSYFKRFLANFNRNLSSHKMVLFTRKTLLFTHFSAAIFSSSFDHDSRNFGTIYLELLCSLRAQRSSSVNGLLKPL